MPRKLPPLPKQNINIFMYETFSNEVGDARALTNTNDQYPRLPDAYPQLIQIKCCQGIKQEKLSSVKQ